MIRSRSTSATVPLPSALISPIFRAPTVCVQSPSGRAWSIVIRLPRLTMVHRLDIDFVEGAAPLASDSVFRVCEAGEGAQMARSEVLAAVLTC